MSGLPEVIYLIKDSCRYEVVWSDSAFPYGDKKYISAAKAKADKLAMLGDIDETLGGMSELVTKDGVSMFWVKLFDWSNKLDQLKQRIGAE